MHTLQCMSNMTQCEIKLVFGVLYKRINMKLHFTKLGHAFALITSITLTTSHASSVTTNVKFTMQYDVERRQI